jgi:chemotaxis protein methyltransferase CheR
MMPMETTFNIEADLSDKEFKELATLVYDHCGINLREGKRDLVRARLAKQMRIGKFSTPQAYLRHVTADISGAEFKGLIDAISTNLTSFFRESTHFDYLNADFLPKLIDNQRRTGQNVIRAWCAGCSTGEEAYSLAMTLLEGTEGAGSWDIKILASDISTRVLDVARRGVYDLKRAQSIPEILRKKYFTTERSSAGSTCRALPHLRNVIAFRYLNLMESWPFGGPFDFIFCRNVMIYFDFQTQERLIRRFKTMLSPGGLLFTGHSESLNGMNHGMEHVQSTIYANASPNPKVQL